MTDTTRDVVITDIECPRAEKHQKAANVMLRQRQDGTCFCAVHGNVTFVITSLQAVEPDALQPQDGIVVTLDEAADSMGFPRVNVYGKTREAVIEYARREWGEEDPSWFADYVVARVDVCWWQPKPSDGDFAVAVT